MNIIILVPLLTLWRACHAGWPCCLKGARDEDRGAYAPAQQKPDERIEPRIERTPDGYTLLSRPGAQPTTYSPSGTTHHEAIPPSQGGAVATLDLSKPEKAVALVEIHENGKMRYINYYERVGCKITSVVDNGEELWSVYQDERFILAEIYEREGTSLLRIDVVLQDEYKPKLFEKAGNKWKVLGICEFFRKLECMRQSAVTRQESQVSEPLPSE